VGDVGLEADPLEADVLDGEATRDEPADLDGDAPLDDVPALWLVDRDAAAPPLPRRRSVGRAPLDTLALFAEALPDRIPLLGVPREAAAPRADVARLPTEARLDGPT
jgi:hypothetical protein